MACMAHERECPLVGRNRPFALNPPPPGGGGDGGGGRRRVSKAHGTVFETRGRRDRAPALKRRDKFESGSSSAPSVRPRLPPPPGGGGSVGRSFPSASQQKFPCPTNTPNRHILSDDRPTLSRRRSPRLHPHRHNIDPARRLDARSAARIHRPPRQPRRGCRSSACGRDDAADRAAVARPRRCGELRARLGCRDRRGAHSRARKRGVAGWRDGSCPSPGAARSSATAVGSTTACCSRPAMANR
jgi:hypothetical protein